MTMEYAKLTQWDQPGDHPSVRQYLREKGCDIGADLWCIWDDFEHQLLLVEPGDTILDHPDGRQEMLSQRLT